jgi:hypothetical protein
MPRWPQRTLACAILVAAAAVFWFGLGMQRGLLLSEDIRSRVWPWAPSHSATQIAARRCRTGLAVRSVARAGAQEIGPAGSSLEPAPGSPPRQQYRRSVRVARLAAPSGPAGWNLTLCSGCSSPSAAACCGCATRTPEGAAVLGARCSPSPAPRRLARASADPLGRARPVAALLRRAALPAAHARRVRRDRARELPRARRRPPGDLPSRRDPRGGRRAAGGGRCPEGPARSRRRAARGRARGAPPAAVRGIFLSLGGTPFDRPSTFRPSTLGSGTIRPACGAGLERDRGRRGRFDRGARARGGEPREPAPRSGRALLVGGGTRDVRRHVRESVVARARVAHARHWTGVALPRSRRPARRGRRGPSRGG